MNFVLKESIKKRKLRAPCSLKIYMNGTSGILEKDKEKNVHIEFIKIFNEIDENVKLIFETETNHTLPFLETLIIKKINGTLQATAYKKQSNTRLTINPSSNQDPKTWIGVFKGAVCRAPMKIFWKTKINYLRNNFENNGYSGKYQRN